MTLDQKILKHSIKHWNERFVGISAFELADKLKVHHKTVLTALQRLKENGSGTLNENVEIGSVSFKLNKTGLKQKPRMRKIVTSIFFPSKAVLGKSFKKNLSTLHSNGEFKNRLHQGFGQIVLFYFNVAVLKRYFDHQDKYSIEDSIVGGTIRMNSQFIKDWDDEQIDKDFFDWIRYGKRKLENGSYTVSVILWDLAELPKSEQNYWASHEIPDAKFATHDREFAKFWLQNFEGEWINHDDPIENIKKYLNEINSLFKIGKFFSVVENPFLSYPVINTKKNFMDCCSELYKLIDPAHIKQKTLLQVFKQLSTFKEQLIKDEKGEALKAPFLFNNFLDELIPETADNAKYFWKQVRDGRVEADHNITDPRATDTNYIDTFKSLCIEISFSLAQMKKAIEETLKTEAK